MFSHLDGGSSRPRHAVENVAEGLTRIVPFEMLTEQQLAALRSEPGSNRVAKAMALAGVTHVTVAKALRLTQPYVSDVARGRHRTITVENAWKFAALLRLPYRGLVPVTPPTVGLKAGRILEEVAAPPAVMSLVTPPPACTGETDRERRPRFSIVDREAGLHGIAIRAGRRRCRRRPVRVCRQRRCTTMG